MDKLVMVFGVVGSFLGLNNKKGGNQWYRLIFVDLQII